MMIMKHSEYFPFLKVNSIKANHRESTMKKIDTESSLMKTHLIRWCDCLTLLN